MLEVAGGADVPWIGKHEASLLVQRPKGAAFVGDSRHGSHISSSHSGGWRLGRYAEFTRRNAASETAATARLMIFADKSDTSGRFRLPIVRCEDRRPSGIFPAA
jgi:hypothetical protein